MTTTSPPFGHRRRPDRVLFVLCLAFAVSLCGGFASAQATVAPNSPTLRITPFEGLDTTSRSAVESAYRADFSIPEPAIEWTGDRSQCLPGTTSDAFLAATLRRLNFFRAMAGVPADAVLDDDMTKRAQAAALVVTQQGELSHAIPPSWPCYSELAARGAATGNLHLGYAGPKAISLFIEDEGSNNARVGHRRWMLLPSTRRVGVGNVPAAGGAWAGSVLVIAGGGAGPTSQPATRSVFVAWPPSGFVPFPLMATRWSFSLPSTDFRTASVRVTQNGEPIPVTIEYQSPQGEGYGDDTLVWSLSSAPARRPSAGHDDTYSVTVVVGATTYRYDVVAFDVDLALTEVPGSSAPAAQQTVAPTAVSYPTSGPQPAEVARDATVNVAVTPGPTVPDALAAARQPSSKGKRFSPLRVRKTLTVRKSSRVRKRSFSARSRPIGK